MPRIKIEISIDDGLLHEVDDYCERNYLSRSALISQSLNPIINQDKMIDSLKNVAIAVRTCAEKGEKIDEETKREIETFETLCKIYRMQG